MLIIFKYKLYEGNCVQLSTINISVVCKMKKVIKEIVSSSLYLNVCPLDLNRRISKKKNRTVEPKCYVFIYGHNVFCFFLNQNITRFLKILYFSMFLTRNKEKYVYKNFMFFFMMLFKLLYLQKLLYSML